MNALPNPFLNSSESFPFSGEAVAHSPPPVSAAASNSSSDGGGESRPASHLVEEDDRPWESRVTNVDRLDDQESENGHGQRSAPHMDSVSNDLDCGAVRGAPVPSQPLSVGRNGNAKRISRGDVSVDPSIGDSDILERRAKALGPHSRQAGLASGPSEAITTEGGAQTPPAAEPKHTDAGELDNIGEIFHYARKLTAAHHRFVLDEQAFFEAIEPPPLFLQRAAE